MGLPEPELKFVVELPSWHRVFFRNLADLVLMRRQPRLQLTTRPWPFWPDVFVERGLPLGAFRKSALYHAFAITVLWGLSHTALLRTPALPQRAFQNTRLTYYPVSEYLPPIADESSSPPAVQERKGEPKYAKQPIISLPRNPDNSTQTIVTPSPLKIDHDVRLPNIVAWTPVPAAVPAAAVRGGPKLAMPENTVVAPPPDTKQMVSRAPIVPQPMVVEPTPAVGNAKLTMPADLITVSAVAPPAATAELRTKALIVPVPSVVEPPASTAAVSRKLGELNIAHFDPKVAAPRLPVAEQRAVNTAQNATVGGPQLRRASEGAGGRAAPANAGSGMAQAKSGVGQSAVSTLVTLRVSATAIQGVGHGDAAGQLIALGIHPVAPNGPIEIPQGNRRGIFAAAPEGKPGAPGTPDVHGGGSNGPGGSSASHAPSASAGGPGKGPNSGTGIFVGAGPVNPGPVAVAAPPADPSATAQGKGSDSTPVLLAAARPHLSDIARQTRPSAPVEKAPKVEDEVFGAKRIYSMTLNMPNLSSSGGSWIIRFAQLRDDGDNSELLPPVATRKVDPGYPSDLMRERLEGTVTLYAIIHSDGTVGDVRVLQGLDSRLDNYARLALSKWHFRPGTKHGNAVEVEAVVQIPFRSVRY
ncbi:MAG: TonB family protein [Terriglobales bacterium]